MPIDFQTRANAKFMQDLYQVVDTSFLRPHSERRIVSILVDDLLKIALRETNAFEVTNS